MLDDDKAVTAVGFLHRAVAHFAALGIRVEQFDDRQRLRLPRRSLHALACKAIHIKHLRTRPYRPRTNGKAERFVRTLLAAEPTAPSTAPATNAAAALAGWLDFYDRRRPHRSLGRQAAIERLRPLDRNNVLGHS